MYIPNEYSRRCFLIYGILFILIPNIILASVMALTTSFNYLGNTNQIPKFVIYNMTFQPLLPNHPKYNCASNIARFRQLLD